MIRENDILLIQEKLPQIADDAHELYVDKYMEPKVDEMEKVYKIIKEFIKKKKRIVYGGYAQNALIKKVYPGDAFYTKYSLADIEFYTPDPIRDGMELTDALHKKGFLHCQLSEGVHNETYKLFSNFVNYADISYLPKNIFDNCPTITVEGMKMAHPHFMLIDAYRVYTDLIMSNFRISKSFSRFTKLQNAYPFNKKLRFDELKYDKKIKNIEDIQKTIRSKIIHNSKLIVVGHYACNYYIKKDNDENIVKYYPYYQLITNDYKNDKKKILDILCKELKEDSSSKRSRRKKSKDIKMKEYYPFSQFFGNHVEYIYKNNVILKVYDNYNRCVPFRVSNKKLTNFGTVQAVILYLLIDYNYAIINKVKNEEKNYLTLLVKLINARNNYLDNKNKSILDNTPFKAFTTECIGEPFDQIRESRLEGKRRLKAGKKFRFEYFPKGNPGKVPNFKFNNTSGKVIN